MSFPSFFNPSMMNNMSPEQMKTSASMFDSMSDDQLRDYAKMAGMPNMDPQMMRQSINMMKNMDQSQFNTMKNMAQNFHPNSGASNNTSSNNNQSSSAPTSTPGKYKKIEELKEKGNKHFKAKEYSAANKSYLDAIIDIEEIRSENRNLRDSALDSLEVSCRLNYANVKSREDDYEVVLSQARAVLNIQENGKAYFRLGQALSYFKKYEEAKKNLEKAKSLIPDDDTVIELYEKVMTALEASRAAEKPLKTKNVDDIEEDDDQTQYPPQQENLERKPSENKGRLKRKNTPDVQAPTFKEERKHKTDVEKPYDYLSNVKNDESEDVTIEEEKTSQSRPAAPQPSSRSSTHTYSPNMSDEAIEKGRKELGNMSGDQMGMMSNFFKNMDNATLKNMLRGQMGMDVSDAQLESMKSMMTPEMLQSFSKMDPSSMPRPGGGFMNPMGASNTTQTSASPSFPMGQPGFGAGNPMMDIKSDQINMMLDMAVKNPEMLKGMAGMLGENNPLSKFIQNRSPEDLAKYMKVFQKLFKGYTKISPAISLLKRNWQIFAGLFVGYIAYQMFG